MAGMEELEIHSKSYLVRWITVPSEHTISWTLLPHKKAINFGIFKHPGSIAGLTPVLPTSFPAAVPSPNPDNLDASKDPAASQEATARIVEKLTGVGLKKISWVGRCEADKIAQGKYDVPAGEGGHYALVLDNTFSKSFSKTATFFLLTYSTIHPPQFGATLHHSQIPATTVPIPSLAKFSPALRPRRDSTDSLSQKSVGQVYVTNLHAVPTSYSPAIPPGSASVHTGILQKRRRKRHQGYARRFFSLDFTTSTLSYYHDRSSSALRGTIPLSLAAIGANAATREISIDSGAEIWHLKAVNASDFEVWKIALEQASSNLASAGSLGDPLKIDTGTDIDGSSFSVDDQEWARLEGVLGRIAGITNAVRRLCASTEPKLGPSHPPGPESSPSTPTDGGNEDTFKAEDKRPFWKRKASATHPPPSLFKRSVSGQLAVPPTGGEAAGQNGAARSVSPVRVAIPPAYRDVNMYEHCKAMLHDLDSVVTDFSALIAESKLRRSAGRKKSVSRMSIDTTGSQEFFDAEDTTTSPFLMIRSDSGHGKRRMEDSNLADTVSVSSSDIDHADEFGGAAKGVHFESITSAFPPKSKSLTPLPMERVLRRINVPAPMIMPPSLIGFLRKNVGKDLSTISMPVSANEPTSLLQRASEQLEYAELLDSAANATDGVERLIYVAAFAMSSMSSNRVKERSIRKPFNPMLGETFELVRGEKGFRCVCEKVSHRPVQLAMHAESKEWAFTQSPMPSQKFWGKSSEIVTDGKARVHLYASGEILSWAPPTSFLRNILAGEKYVEPVGSMAVVNETTGQQIVITFKAKGVFAGRSEEVSAQSFDAHGQLLPLGLQGTWTHALCLVEHGTVTKKTIWSVGPLVDQASKHYGFTSFAATLNEVTDVERDKLPPTDSRLRPDQMALEEGDHERAEQVKTQLEEKQRSRRKEMEASGASWEPRWFSKTEVGGEVTWRLKTGKDGYWDERARGTWGDVIPVLKA